MGLYDMLDEKQNITAGVIILSELQSEFDTTESILMAYNLGASKANKYLAKGITSTEYTQKILGGN
jgi:soluble lytic murein transglycosylase-like protein